MLAFLTEFPASKEWGLPQKETWVGDVNSEEEVLQPQPVPFGAPRGVDGYAACDFQTERYQPANEARQTTWQDRYPQFKVLQGAAM